MKLALTLALVGAVLWWMQASVSATAPGDADVPPHDPIDPDIEPTGMQALAHAIATAEGFGVPGAIPTRAHNPGDLVIPGWTGDSLGVDGISVFSSDAEGWGRLYRQLNLINAGASRVYTRDMTLADFAGKWTTTQVSAWLSNVVAALQTSGVDASPDTTLAEVFG